ncbi:MAG: fimbrillin family protein, partial [Rikenellaceae bacterium]|nr:fimbrillin family protein [Rikenellaceae bacterium]
MKKLIYICGALALAGCSDRFEPAAQNGKQPDAISFNVYNAKQTNTRAALQTVDSLKNGTNPGFKLWGYEVGASIYITNLGGEMVTWRLDPQPGNNYEWEYGDPTNSATQAAWPSVPANFVAIAGTTQGVTEPAAGASTISTLQYTVPTIATSQEDLLVAATLNQTKSSNQGRVDLNFKHALSAIAVSAKFLGGEGTVAGDTAVTIKSISLINFNTSGSLDITTAAAAGVPTWTGQGTPTSGEVTIFNSSTVLKKADNASYTPLVTPVDPYMILPQTTVKGTSVYEATGAQVSGAT